MQGDQMIRPGQWTDGSHPVSYAFDGNENTYMIVDGSNHTSANGSNWVGLDLGKQCVITRVAFCPRVDIQSTDYPDRLLLGIFEGGNQPGFGDAVPLAMVKTVPDRRLTFIDVNCSRGVRYVRFVFPSRYNNGYASTSNYLAEFQIFGYEGAGDNSHLPQITNLPVISIHTNNEKNIVSREEYQQGKLTAIYNNGSQFFDDSTEVRGRGNASWGYDKKPYRIKLYKKTRLLGQPCNAKSWTLINNWGDKTLMRNLLAFDFSRKIGMPYTSIGIPVDVILNGVYQGCYQFCDQMEVREKRVEAEGDGGMMVEIDAYAEGEGQQGVAWFTTKGRAPYEVKGTIKYPDNDEITPQQSADLQAQFIQMISSVNTITLGNQNTFEANADIETFLRHFLTGEYSGNTDTYWSVYTYKKPGNDIWYFGPVWDFDLAFYNDDRTQTYMNSCFSKTNPIYNWLYPSGSAEGQMKDIVNKIMQYPKQQNRLKAIWTYYRDRNLISKEKLIEEVDRLAAEMQESQTLNFKRWTPLLTQKVHQNFQALGSYEAEVNWVKQYINNRMDWLDKKLEYTIQTPYTIRFNKPKSWEKVLLTAWIPGEYTNDSVLIFKDLELTATSNDWYICSLDYGYRNMSVQFSNGNRAKTVPVSGISNAICLGTTGELDAINNYVTEEISCNGKSVDTKPLTVYFKKPQRWSTARLTAWVPGVWAKITPDTTPDIAMQPVPDNEDYFQYTFATNDRHISLCFNDSEHFVSDTVRDMMSNLCLGTNGKMSGTGWKTQEIDCENGQSIEPQTITVRFNLPETWTESRIRAWLPDANNQLLTATEGDPMSPEQGQWYTHSFRPGENNISLRFNNGNNLQTNIISSVNQDICIGTTGKIAGELWLADTIDCENGQSKVPGAKVEDWTTIPLTLITNHEQIILNKNIDSPLFVSVITVLGQALHKVEMTTPQLILPVPSGFYIVQIAPTRTRQQHIIKCVVTK
ncbi:MAG: CotH kinase family protein [Bacteroidales bacterium]|nr:CotH kinase family protein [Bacteroidales bacterium]